MPSYILKSVQTGGYLDGSREPIWDDAMDACSSPFILDQNHLRPNSDGTSRNPREITWNLKPNGKESYFLQCNQNGYFLDGGPEYIWKYAPESNHNTEFISWNIKPAGNDCFYIQCVKHSGYLDAGKNHIWSDIAESNPNPNYIKWILLDPAKPEKPITSIVQGKF
jgi:hypothetical protein